jgi:hypothetical protein
MSKSFLNQLRENPVPAGIGIAIVLGVIAFLIWYFFFRGKKVQAGPGVAAGVKPSITFGESAMILNPDSENVETYKIEYATENLGKNIDISINWKNGAGFVKSDVESIVVKRKKDSSYINVDDGKDTKTITDADFLTDFADCEVEILGKFIGDSDVVGDNVIEVYYTTAKSSALILLGSVTVTIEQNHLDTTIDLASVTSITIPPTRGGDISSVLDVPAFTTFSITPKDGSRVIVDNIRFEQLDGSVVKLKDVYGTQIMLGDRDTETYVFEKYLDESFFIRPSGVTDKYFVNKDNSLVLTDKGDLFKTQDKLNSALFNINKGAPIIAPPLGPPPCPWGYTRKYGSSVCTDDYGCTTGQTYDEIYGDCM